MDDFVDIGINAVYLPFTRAGLPVKLTVARSPQVYEILNQAAGLTSAARHNAII